MAHTLPRFSSARIGGLATQLGLRLTQEELNDKAEKMTNLMFSSNKQTGGDKSNGNGGGGGSSSSGTTSSTNSPRAGSVSFRLNSNTHRPSSSSAEATRAFNFDGLREGTAGGRWRKGDLHLDVTM